MRHQSFFTAFCGLSLFALIACSSDSSSGGGGTKGKGAFTNACGSNGQQCTGDQTAYENCLIGKCDADIAAAYGAGYKTGAFAGPCGAYAQCTVACPCDANYNGCQQGCLSKMTTDCQSAGMKAGTCIQNAGCTDPCAGGGGSGQGGSGQGGSGMGGSGMGGMAGGGTGGGGGTVTCEQLKGCCGKLPAGQQQDACMAVANAGDEANCNQAGVICSM